MVEADYLLAAIEKRFLETGHPCDLTLVHSLGIGDRDSKGSNRFAHAKMLKRVIAGHFTWSPKMQALVKNEEIEAYCFPGGVIQALLREIGAGRPGLITHVGLGSFVDPRHDGGKSNAITREDLVELIEIDGETKLRYRPFAVDYAIVRGPMPTRAATSAWKKKPSIWTATRWRWRHIIAAARSLFRCATCLKRAQLPRVTSPCRASWWTGLWNIASSRRPISAATT
ncbi:bifunctional putative acetyl-CoA:acetoacetyl-CoA transferase: alpha subunit/beta subunit [Klebsiella variicola]|nr:bifunctional putative acetyl-CoA:acetoacetyl-CoA transferase: alpha subunit/beta subunit [Klebsiella variicola]